MKTIGLSQGKDSAGTRYECPVWYTHGGEYFRDEKDCHEVIVTMRVRGWHTGPCEGSRDVAIGIVARLPHGRFLAGYRWTANDERVYFPGLFDDECDAARMANEHARVFAERNRKDYADW